MEFSSITRNLISAAIWSAGLSSGGSAQSESLASPDNRLVIVFETTKNHQPTADGGQLVYSVTLDGKPVIIRSQLGLKFQGHPRLRAEVSDHPGAYANEPAFQFIKDVPATWDELRVIDGTPGEHVTLVRRSGAEWFLGSMTNWTPREITIPLDFLSEETYVAEIYRGAPDSGSYPKHTIIERIDSLPLNSTSLNFIPIPQSPGALRSPINPSRLIV